MYAIVDIAGQQVKVEKDQEITVNSLKAKEGDKVEFDKVMLIDNDGKVKIGDPIIKNAKVTAKVIENGKGGKVIVFKKKRRKGYKVKNGHRQHLSTIKIENIQQTAAKAKKEPAAEKKEENKAENNQ